MNVSQINPALAKYFEVPKSNGSDKALQSSFGDILQNTIDRLEENIDNDNSLLNSIMTGESDDFYQFIIETEKTSMTLELTLQVRNKIIDAYKEIMNMQL